MTKTAHLALRRQIVDTCRRMNALGVNQGTSGNVSARIRGGLLITPSGVPYDAMTPEGIVALAPDGTVTQGGKPSSEWRFHVDILAARPDAGAIVHTHSIHATALSCLRRDIPAFHYMVAAAGGDTIRCARYATFGTQELSDHALAALDGRRACLLANHGVIATGRDIAAALALAVEVETLAHQYLLALQVGKPTILSAAEMRRVVEKFRSYGPR